MLYLGPSALTYHGKSAPEQRIDNWQQFYQQQAQSARHPLLQSFYQAGMISADTPVSDAPLLALDIETTERGELYSIALEGCGQRQGLLDQ